MDIKSGVVKYEKKDRVASITLNRPEKMNAMNSELVRELRNAWIDFETDPDMRVAILTGNGKAFCAGMDLDEASRGTPLDLNGCIPNAGIEITKPIIGAINGWGSGAGMGLALSCDIKVMSESAKFFFPEAKIGYARGGLELLTYAPYSIAMEIWLTGEPLDAKRAYEVCIVNKVVPPAELMKEALRYADLIKGNAPLTMKMLKMFAIDHTQNMKSKWLMMEARYVKPQVESEDIKEGMRAFREKRKPIFKGK